MSHYIIPQLSKHRQSGRAQRIHRWCVRRRGTRQRATHKGCDRCRHKLANGVHRCDSKPPRQDSEQHLDPSAASWRWRKVTNPETKQMNHLTTIIYKKNFNKTYGNSVPGVMFSPKQCGRGKLNRKWRSMANTRTTPFVQPQKIIPSPAAKHKALLACHKR